MPVTVTNRFLRKQLEIHETITEDVCYELKYSALIIAIKEDKFATVHANGNEFIALFTDIHEYYKQNLGADFRPQAYYFNFYLELLKDGSEGFVINPKSERFIITSEILDVMDTDYMFDLDYQPITFSQTKRIYESLDNCRIDEFIKEDRWDFHELMEILMKSDLLTLISTRESLDEIDGTGIYDCVYPTSFQCMDNYALLFSKHIKGNNHVNSYSQLVNLPLFIDETLKHDLSGTIFDNSVVLSREFLIEYMKDFKCPSLDDYAFFAFSMDDVDE